MSDTLVILTRSEPQNREIVCGLKNFCQCLSLPLFRLVQTRSPERARRELMSAEAGDVINFVSPTAVRFAKELVPEMPRGARLTAPGITTMNAVRREWPQNSYVENEASVSESGSEVLAQLLIKEKPSRVFVVRAQSGREFLSDRLASVGIPVIPVEVYVREPARWSASQVLRLQMCMNKCRPILYIASSEAVGVLVREAGQLPGMIDWLRSGCVITIHPRIAERLHRELFCNVEIVGTHSDEVVARIRQLCSLSVFDAGKI